LPRGGKISVNLFIMLPVKMRNKIVLCAGIFFLIGIVLFSCKKEDDTQTTDHPVSPNWNHSVSLAGQTWVIYEYDDYHRNESFVRNDTLRFIDENNLIWNDSACSYMLWENLHDRTRGMNMYYTPIGDFLQSYNSLAPFSQDSTQFRIFFSPNCNLWFRRL
jgi:hypothetical protein